MVLKVHEAPGASMPPLSVKRLVPVKVDPVPQTSLAGKPMASRPAKAASRSSVKVMSVIVSLSSRLVIVKSRTTVSPGDAESSANSLSNSSSPEDTVSKSTAAGTVVTGSPNRAAKSVVVLRYWSEAALPGTARVALNVHDSPGPKLPPLNISRSVPVSDEPEPQGSDPGKEIATSPGSVWSRSSSNLRSVAVCVVALSIVNSSVTVSPGTTGSSVNSFVNDRPVTSRSSDAGAPVVSTPSTVAVRSLVVLV